MTTTRVPGHELIGEGAPHNARGTRLNHNGVGGTGRGLCSCGALSDEMSSGAARRRWHTDHKATVATPDDASHDDCPGCAEDAKHNAALAAAGMPIPLPDELTAGLTIYGTWGGAQIQMFNPVLLDDTNEPLTDDNGLPITGPAIATLALAIRAGAPTAGQLEDGNPIYQLSLPDARALRDLLNIATARGVL